MASGVLVRCAGSSPQGWAAFARTSSNRRAAKGSACCTPHRCRGIHERSTWPSSRPARPQCADGAASPLRGLGSVGDPAAVRLC
jgi:hypothetical protein